MSLTAEPADTAGFRTVSVTEFRANCPTLFNAVRETGQEIIVTKHGHPVARVAPVRRNSPSDTLVGMAKDIIHLPPDFDIDEEKLLDPDWHEQWSAKWDQRLTTEAGPDEDDERSL